MKRFSLMAAAALLAVVALAFSVDVRSDPPLTEDRNPTVTRDDDQLARCGGRARGGFFRGRGGCRGCG